MSFIFSSSYVLMGSMMSFVLRKACLVYREAFLEGAGLDPFECTTFASCCMAVFKNTISTPWHSGVNTWWCVRQPVQNLLRCIQRKTRPATSSVWGSYQCIPNCIAKLLRERRFIIMSLTRYTQPYRRKKSYPVGHPKIIFRGFKAIDKYFGLIKCTVLPPPRLVSSRVALPM